MGKPPAVPNVTFESLISPMNRKDLFRIYDNEYESTLKQLSNLRLHKMQANMQEIDNEHKQELRRIHERQYLKHQYETQQLHAQENTIVASASAEIADYEHFKEARNLKAVEKMQNAELQRKNLERKVQQRNEEKRQRVGKIRALAQLSQPANKVVATIKAIYQKCKAAGNEIPQTFTQLIGQVSKEFNECSAIISMGVNTPNADLEQCTQQATAKVKSLESLLKACEKIINAIEEQRLMKDKAKKEADEKAKKDVAAAAAAAAATTAAKEAAQNTKPTQQQPITVATSNTATTATTAHQAPPLPPHISVANSVPALAPLEETLRPILSLCCPKPVFNDYLRLQKNLLDTTKFHEPVSKSTDKAVKTFKFDLYKVINTTINAISDESPKHLLDKIMKINTLLTGQDIDMAGKKISVKDSKYGMV